MNKHLERKNADSLELQAKECQAGIERRTGVERLQASLKAGTARLRASQSVDREQIDREQLVADSEQMKEDFAQMQADCNLHLSDEQFTELLLGEIPVGAQAHLLTCAQCSDEAERVLDAIGDFAQQSRLWAERRTASWPIPVVDRRIALGGRFHLPAWMLRSQAQLRPQMWLVAALTLALVSGGGFSLHRGYVSSVQRAVAIAPVSQSAAVAPATLKADNELLSAIDGELRADESASASQYGLDVSSSVGRNRTAKRIAN
jgi:hypothetical protein